MNNPEYNIGISANDLMLIIRNNYISTLILESENEINMNWLTSMSNDELAQQIQFLKVIKKMYESEI